MNWHPPVIHWPQLPDWSEPLLFGLLFICLGWFCFRQFRQGKASMRGTTVYRDTQPFLFWFVTGSWVFLITVGTLGIVAQERELVQKHIIGQCDPANTGTKAYYRDIANICGTGLHSAWANSATLQRLHDNRGFAFYRADDSAAAINEFSAVIAMDPTDAWAFYMRGLAYSDLKKWDAAVANYKSAIKQSPTYPDPYGELANIEFRNRKYDAALADVSKALQYAPDNTDLLSKRCWFRALTNRQADAALNDCNRAIKFDTDPTPDLETRALVYYRLGNYAQSVADSDAALAKDPQSITTLYVRGLAKERLNAGMGDTDIASARDKSPGDVDSLVEFGFKPQ